MDDLYRTTLRYIGRDKITDQMILREVIRTDKTCSWCGNNYKNRLFAYYAETNGSGHSKIKGAFCNVECMRNYCGR
jgi:hypothetical protein